MPNNDCSSYHTSVIRSPALITPSLPSATTRQPVVRFARNTPVFPSSSEINLSLPGRISSPREKQHFHFLSVHGKMRMVAETVCGSVSSHSRAASARIKECYTRIVRSESHASVSEILASQKSSKGLSAKKSIPQHNNVEPGLPAGGQQSRLLVKENVVSIIREPDTWNHDAMDIAAYGVADYLDVMLDIEDVEYNTHLYAGNIQHPEKVIYLRRFRLDGLEHYQLIEKSGGIRNVMADGNCLFRAVAAGYYGNEEAWQDLRQQTADHIYDQWEHYEAFIPKESSVILKGETELSQKNLLKNISLSSQYPILSEAILNHVAMALRRDLEVCFDPSLSSGQKDLRRNRVSVSNALSHFISRESVKKVDAIEKFISNWIISSEDKIKMIKRLRELAKGPGDYSAGYIHSPSVRVNEKDFDTWDVLVRAANQELAYVLWRAGPTQKQFSLYLALSEAATLVQVAHRLPVKLTTLLSGDGDKHLRGGVRKIKNKLIVEMISMMVFNFRQVSSKIWQKIYQYNDMFSHLVNSDIFRMKSDFYLTANIDVVADRTRDEKDEIIKARVNRLMVERFYQRVSIINLYRATVDNSPLFLNRSDVNADTRKLIRLESGKLREEVVKSLLSFERGKRVRILFDNMFIAPLVIGDGFRTTSVNLIDLPFGVRGLSIEEIDRQLIDNRDVSDEQLRAIAIFSNRLLREITTGVDFFPRVKWILNFSGDTLLSFFLQYRNFAEDSGYAYFLVDKLQVIAQRIYGGKSFGEDVMTLLDHSMKFCHGEVLTIDELAFILTSHIDGIIKIINIAGGIADEISEPENHYDAQNEWRKFVVSFTRNENIRSRLNERRRLSQQDTSLQ